MEEQVGTRCKVGMPSLGAIDCPRRMIEAIRHYGVIPFFKGIAPGWSIEELTAPGCWFAESEEFGSTLGPWDWKIDCVREGDIAYGKFLGGKAAFATVEYYRHLMNFRRSLPRYRMALGEEFEATTASDKLMKVLSPIALSAIKEAGALESPQIRSICAAKAPQIALKKSLMDSVMQFLQMGTWSVIGDFRRLYRGPNLSYSGWQRASNTTPDALFGGAPTPEEDMPDWARSIVEAETTLSAPECGPEESRQFLISHIMQIVPAADRKKIEKIV